MTITLQLPPGVEAELRARAARKDAAAVRDLLTQAITPAVDAAVADLLNASNDTPSVRHTNGLTDAEFEALADELAGLLPAAPSLPNHAVSREGIYGDHP